MLLTEIAKSEGKPGLKGKVGTWFGVQTSQREGWSTSVSCVEFGRQL